MPGAGGRTEDWLAAFAEALAASDPVAGRYVLDGRVIAYVAGESPVEALQAEARAFGVPRVVVVNVTRAGGVFSLDATVLPDHAAAHLARHTMTTEPPLGPALAVLGRQVGRSLRSLPPAARIVPLAQEAPVPDSTVSLEELEAAVTGEGLDEPVPDVLARVVELRIEGNRRVDADAVRAVIQTQVGDRVVPQRISADVKRIFELGFFRDVRVFRAAVRGGQLVTFIVEENPVIRQVTVTGNSEIDADDIKDRLSITPGSTIDFPLLIENTHRVEALYQSKGFYLAEVEYKVEALDDDAVLVDFDIVEGNKLRLRKVEFTGNEAFDDDELMQGLVTKPWRWTSWVSSYWDTSGLYAEPLFYQDLDRITRRYMDKGFVRVKVGEPKVEYDDSGIDVAVDIQEGPQYFVGQVDVVGDETTDTEELMGRLSLETGDVFSRTILTNDVEAVRSRYADRGFFDARVRPRTDVDPDLKTVDVVFEVEKGELYFVDWIKVSGNRRTRDEVVRREMGIAEGDLFSDGSIDRSRARVRRLGYFEEVNVETEPSAPGRLGVTVDVVERPTGAFSFGAGFGSTDGFLLNASISQDNLFGRGYGLQASVDFGSNNRFGSISFSNPYFRGTPAALSVSTRLSSIEFIDFQQDILGGSINVSYPLDEGETRVGVGYGYNSRDISNVNDFQAASLVQREEFQDATTTSLMTFSIRRDTRDDIRFPKRGQVMGVAIEPAGLGGLARFLRMEGRITRYMPAESWLGFDSTFIINSRIGWVLPFNDISDFDDLPPCTSAACVASLGPQVKRLAEIDDDLELPLTERYFLGGLGAFQLRGFKQRSLGPRRPILTPQFADLATGERSFTPSGGANDINETDPDKMNLDLADVIGGNKMFLANFELQVPISESLGLTGIVFFDMGNAFAENESMNPADFRFGTGGGVQWFSPFGPILLELGFPLDRLDDEDNSVFEFSLGGSQF